MRRHIHVSPLKIVAAVLAVTAVSVGSPQVQPESRVSASTAISLELIGRANSGVGNAGSEIAAYDKAAKRLFVTNGSTNKIDIFDLANVAAPTLVTSVDLASLGATGVQSVAAKNGLVAVAASVGGNNQAAGKIFFMSATGAIDTRAPSGVEVGSLPDSVHFSPDGRFALSANEGEPRDYCLTNGALPTTTDPHGSVSIIDTSGATLAATTLDFAAMNARASEIRGAGGRVYGPNATVAQDLEPEYIAISADSTKAWVTLQENNAIAEIDIVNKKIVKLLGLGYKDHSTAGNGLDPSDQDSATNSGVNIATWNVKGMYQPDAIASFTDSAGNHYFATANEGDAREYKCLLGGASTASAQAEDSRVSSVGVDGTILASTLSSNANLGRLGVTRFEPATYSNNGTATTSTGSTDFTSLYTLGARSLSIWKSPTGTNDIAAATLVADTGDAIERKIAELQPTYFNGDWNTSTGTPNAKDTRSDNKGPEPEGLAVAKVFGRTIAFVGLERIGGVMAFDVSNPAQPIYQTYVNSSVFTGVGGSNFTAAGAPAGDVSPEGLLYVKASDSPNGQPLLIVAHELSGTTAIYRIVGTATKAAAPANAAVELSGTTAKVTWEEPEFDGGAPITGYVVRSVPQNKTCSTTALTCTVKGLQPGVRYRFVVNAKTTAMTGESSTPTNQVQTAYFKGQVGSAVKVSPAIPSTQAQGVGIFVLDKQVSVGIVPPATTDRTKRVLRYSVALWNTAGKRISSRRVAATVGTTATVTLTAPTAGKYKVVISSGYLSGNTKLWQSSVFVVR